MVGVEVTVGVGVGEFVGVCVGVWVTDCVAVTVAVFVTVAVGVTVGVEDEVDVGVVVGVLERVGVGDAMSLTLQHTKASFVQIGPFVNAPVREFPPLSLAVAPLPSSRAHQR